MTVRNLAQKHSRAIVDMLHVAPALEFRTTLQVDTSLTFDRNQRRLAALEGLKTPIHV